jgi:DUF4097 and DUF4098 domain-containing protein YvlB
MKKFKAWHLALICLAVFLVFAGISAIVIATNPQQYNNVHNWNWNWKWNSSNSIFNFGVGKEYTIDETKTIDVMNKSNVQISGVSSDITITQSQGDKLTARLHGDYKSRNGEIKLEILEKTNALRIIIKHPKMGGVNYSNLKLDITIPQGYNNDLSVNTVSSNILFECKDMTFRNVSTNNVSGKTDIDSLTAKSLDVDTVSGGVIGELLDGTLDITGVSANVDVKGLSNKVRVNTVSGKVILQFNKLTEDVNIDTTSGRIEFTLPEDSEFYVRFDSVSGNFKCDIPVNIIRQKGGDFEGYVGSESAPELDVDSVSGSLEIDN